MDLKKIQSFIDLAKENNVTSLTYKEKEVELSVSFETKLGLAAHNIQHDLVSEVTTNQNEKTVNVTESSGHEIVSPLVGTYYESSAPGKEPFVKVGDHVSVGQTLCIVEAMKIMNEIEANVSGKVTKIFASNEEFVEYGQVLFLIEP